MSFIMNKICGAIEQAASEQVPLLVFHECALCGYLPVETDIEKIDNAGVEAALGRISGLAEKYRMFIAVGTVRMEAGKRYNSIVLFDDGGRCLGYYDKMALWGWDQDNFERGKNTGLFKIDGIRVGFRLVHLSTRAVENVMTVVSVNSVSNC